MCVKRIEESANLYCYKITFETTGKVMYLVDTSISDAATSANEFGEVKSIEYLGEGAIGC